MPQHAPRRLIAAPPRAALVPAVPAVPTIGPEAETLDEYVASLVHDWCKILAILAGGLLLCFIPLDYLLVPRDQFTGILVARLVVVGLAFGLYLALRASRPGRKSYVLGHFLAILVGTLAAIFTTFTGGLESPYYAAFNLIIVAINLVLPWGVVHTLINTAALIALYVGINLALPQDAPAPFATILNNLTFIGCTAIFAVVGSRLKGRLVADEFAVRRALRAARDTLWSEMGLAKQIQTALLPSVGRFGGYEFAALMVPAEEVGGDYYDRVETADGERWITIGDVSGHGVESGLVMMMAQTSFMTAVKSTPGLAPAAALTRVNATLFENIGRMRAGRYMTMTALRLDADRIVFAGLHQDLLVWRARTREVETRESTGTWLGMLPSIDGALKDAELALEPGDVLLLFTDGVTEAADASGVMFGVDRLAEVLRLQGAGDPATLVQELVAAAIEHADRQSDDITVVALRRIATTGVA